ncbi:electron transport complex protein RnfE [Pseudobutyrivibrio sp. 49]|uniref:electron transport complex subunit RsxE n=1 Tax=unclassified Pseudobutyrivibrio TaxID=2638619 RepID=UPI000885A645|nr:MULTISPECIES: electron transport complex subunit E [unclassified Pseudobutyrivibrio]SDH46250.1 electron transport complex protein RnfE [Pseudobutyrivibrio sp. 49]SFN42785.1 electron transport complex protein RnfE [Pseudobutyrivibrio sp. UC1225]
MNKYLERLYNGLWKENPTFVLMLGMCPTLAVTTSAINGIGMGLSTTVVLVLSNMMISALRNLIPDRVRMPAFIVVVASFVTIVQFLMEGFTPSLYESLGIYIPLIVVNCIILGRAESYASKNPVIPSMFDGIGMGLGFTVGLTLIGMVREILGNGSFFGNNIAALNDYHITLFGLAPGAFFVLGFLVAIMNIIRKRMEAKGKPLPAVQGCFAGDCSGCSLSSACTGKSLVHHVEELPPVNPKDVAKPQMVKQEVKHTANAKNVEDVEKSGSDSSYADDIEGKGEDK